MAEIGFGLDTGQDPGWRMMRSRPAIADRDGPALSVRCATPNTPATLLLRGSEPFPDRAGDAAS
jgi:hypothetical protein